MRHPIGLLGLAGLLACGTPPAWDDRPPRLVASDLSADGRELSLEFDEPVSRAEAVAGPPAAPGAAPGPAPAVENRRVRVPVPGGLEPGRDYRWTARVEDAGANTTEVAGRFYGPNDHPARLTINELRLTGSGPHPDFVELRADAGGSLGGWTVEYREAAGRTRRLVLEDREVSAGTLVLIYLKAPADAKKPETAPGAVVLVWPGDGGFSAVRGCLVLRPSPSAEPSDGVTWAATAGQGTALAAEGSAWREVDPRSSTATRTWCRTAAPEADWMLVTTGAATPGGPNRLSPWEGQPASRKPSPKSSGKPGVRRRRRSAGPGGPWPRKGGEPEADGEAGGPAVPASGPRTTPPPGLPGSTALPRAPRRRRKGHRWAGVRNAEADGEAAGARRPSRS